MMRQSDAARCSASSPAGQDAASSQGGERDEDDRRASALLTWLASGGRATAAAADDPLFRDKVAPILERRCVHCHGDATPKGNLSLSTAAAALKGGDSGPAVVPGKPDESLLLDMIAGDPPEMPQKEQAALEAGGRRHPQLDRAGCALAGRAGAARIAGSTARRGGRSSRSIGPRSPRSASRAGSARRSTPSSSAELENAGLCAQPRGRSPHLDPPPHLRPDRPAADARGDRRVRRRCRSRRLRDAGRPAARQSRITASGGAGTGSTSSTTATPTATTRTSAAITPGRIATM